MPVRSELLAAGRRTDAVLTTVYTTPDGDTTILKRATFFNVSTSATINVLVAIDAGTFDKTPWLEFQLAARGRADFDCWHVIPAGAELAIRGDVAGGCNYWFSGAELAGVSS